MRGLILSHPAVAGVLSPYIVTWFEGPDDAIPRHIIDIERAVSFRPRGNMGAFVLDADGRPLCGFVPYPGETPFDTRWGEPAEHFATNIRAASKQLGLAETAVPAAPRLPTLPPSGLATPAGVRAFVSIRNDMNVHVPLVETHAVPRAAWETLAYPTDGPRELPARVAAHWLAGMYPPAMMDQENRISEVRGTLTLTADPDEKGHGAVLAGDVELVLAAATRFKGRFADPGRNFVDFPIRGRLEVALTYGDGNLPRKLNGMFRATYHKPLPPRAHHRPPPAYIEGVLESIP